MLSSKAPRDRTKIGLCLWAGTGVWTKNSAYCIVQGVICMCWSAWIDPLYTPFWSIVVRAPALWAENVHSKDILDARPFPENYRSNTQIRFKMVYLWILMLSTTMPRVRAQKRLLHLWRSRKGSYLSRYLQHNAIFQVQFDAQCLETLLFSAAGPLRAIFGIFEAGFQNPDKNLRFWEASPIFGQKNLKSVRTKISKFGEFLDRHLGWL